MGADVGRFVPAWLGGLGSPASCQGQAKTDHLAAARVFADLVSQVSDQMWESPGLGVWSLRELVGHTSTAALSGVLTAFDKPAQTMARRGPERT